MQVDDVDKIATLHMLLPEETTRLREIFTQFQCEIEVIVERAKLDKTKQWFPSADFKWLMKVQTGE